MYFLVVSGRMLGTRIAPSIPPTGRMPFRRERVDWKERSIS